MKKTFAKIILPAAILSSSLPALAQESAAMGEVGGPMPESAAEPAPDEAAPAPAAPASAAPASAAPTEPASSELDGMRFRFGVSGGPGLFTLKDDFGNKVGVTYGGVDLRLGAQINNMIGIYAQPVLGYYTVGDGFFASGGLAGISVAGDVTLMDRLFVGGGLGYHIYNNPAGPSLLLRAGGYPLMGKSTSQARRKGLMLGVDLRVSFITDLKPVVQPTFNIGYEAF